MDFDVINASVINGSIIIFIHLPCFFLLLLRVLMTAMAEISDGLSEDLVIEEILTRLPVKSLMRFRCVCKSWYALVESPYFISKHLDRSNKNNNRIHDHDDDDDGSASCSSVIVKCRRNRKDSFSLLSYETQTLDVISEDLGEFPFFRDVDPRRVDVNILGCCNGVICLYNSWSPAAMVLWNPATRQMKLIPDSPIPDPKHSIQCGLERGFGYDAITNDYKVIRIVKFRFPHHFWPIEMRTEVYSLSTDSWRLIDLVVPGSFMGMANFRTCVNGIFSVWISVSNYQEEEEDKEVLFSFDMSKEVSLLSPLPELLDADGNECNNFTALRSLNQSLALIHDISALKLNHFHVWVLNEYGPDGSWTKLYTIGPLFTDFFEPLGFWKNDELFFVSNGELVLCDTNTRELKSLQVDGEYFELFAYKESLVSLSIKGGNHLA